MINKVLVVDDDRDALTLLGKILELNGMEVIACDSAQEAYVMAKMESVDLILLDIMMPDINGLELCKMLRTYPTLKVTPIYFITAYNSVDIERQAEMAGADGVINKPISVDKIKKLLSTSLVAQMRKSQAS